LRIYEISVGWELRSGFDRSDNPFDKRAPFANCTLILFHSTSICVNSGIRRSRRRWMMSTIAAAFRYQHGILLCADSEYRLGSLTLLDESSFPIKLPNCGTNLVIALTGSIPEGSSAIQTLRYALQSERQKIDEETLRESL